MYGWTKLDWNRLEGRRTFWDFFGVIYCCCFDWFFLVLVFVPGLLQPCTAWKTYKYIFFKYFDELSSFLFIFWNHFNLFWESYAYFGESYYLQIWDFLSIVMLQHVVQTNFGESRSIIIFIGSICELNFISNWFELFLFIFVKVTKIWVKTGF